MHRWRRMGIAVATAWLMLWPLGAAAHDPDTRGGVFRTLDAGVTWTSAGPGIFGSGALSLAVDPRDPNHLLLASDSGMWRSRNGGRDWDVEAPGTLQGAAFAAAFDAGGQRAFVATSSSLFVNEGDGWRPLRTPAGSMPARGLVAPGAPGRVYMAGRSGLYRSDDGGRSWTDAGRELNAEHVDALRVPAGQPDTLHVLAAGAVWSSGDGARSWQRRADAAPAQGFEAVGQDPIRATRLWAVAAGQLYTSARAGDAWRAIGSALPEPRPKALAVAVDAETIVVATDRGVFRSADGGKQWVAATEGLPAHLYPHVLVGTPMRGTAALYAAFAVNGYDELLPRGASADSANSPWDVGTLVLASWLMVLLGAAALVATRRTSKRSMHAASPPLDGSLR